MTDQRRSEIVVLLDRSGSMQTIRSDMEGAFNAFIEEQRKANIPYQAVPPHCLVSLYQFDDGFERVYEQESIWDVPPLSLKPRGETALYDALGQAITHTGERLGRMPENFRPGKVIFILITDGKENCSREYGLARVRQMIEHQEKVYSWAFVYLGSAPSTFEDAQALGITSVSSYTPSARGVANMGMVVGAAVANYAVGTTMDIASFKADIPTIIPETNDNAKPQTIIVDLGSTTGSAPSSAAPDSSRP